MLISIGVRMWEELAKIQLAELTEEQALVGEYLDRYPEIFLQPDVPNPQQLVNLIHNSNLNILERLAAKTESGVLESVLSELVTSEGPGKHIADWVSNLRSEDFSEDGGQALILVFKVLQKKNPAPGVYHVIIEGTIWRDFGSINLTIDKIRILEEIEQISEESTELIRTKMKDHNSSDLIAVASEANRNWLRQKLIIES